MKVFNPHKAPPAVHSNREKFGDAFSPLFENSHREPPFQLLSTTTNNATTPPPPPSSHVCVCEEIFRISIGVPGCCPATGSQSGQHTHTQHGESAKEGYFFIYYPPLSLLGRLRSDVVVYERATIRMYRHKAGLEMCSSFASRCVSPTGVHVYSVCTANVRSSISTRKLFQLKTKTVEIIFFSKSSSILLVIVRFSNFLVGQIQFGQSICAFRERREIAHHLNAVCGSERHSVDMPR